MPKKNSYSLFSNDGDKQDDTLDAICPKLTYKQRLYGFGICAGGGWIISFLSLIAFMSSDYTTFGIVFTMGNLIAIGSTCFLSGPKDQAKKMIAPQRYISTIIFFTSMVFTIICAAVIQIPIVVLLSALIQFAAYGWYSLSFIPYGQKMLKKACASCFEA